MTNLAGSCRLNSGLDGHAGEVVILGSADRNGSVNLITRGRRSRSGRGEGTAIGDGDRIERRRRAHRAVADRPSLFHREETARESYRCETR